MGNPHVRASNIFESVYEDFVCVLVVAKLLLLARNIDCNLYSLSHVTNSSVEFKGPLRLFRNIVSFAHQVVYKLMS